MSREQRIYDALFIGLKPDTLLIENESSRHNVPTGSETHFKVVAVSKLVEGLSLIARHRLVNKLLVDEFTSGLHALSLYLYTRDEWERQTSGAPASPACHNHKNSKS